MKIGGCGCCNGTGKIRESEFMDGDEQACMTCDGSGIGYETDDPSPYCSQCGAMKQATCKCGPIADNE